MAVIIPLLAVYGGVTAGMAMAAGAAVTFGGVMAVAGGMAAGLGVLTGDKDFQRLGSTLSAVSGLANAAQGLAGAGEASQAFNAADGSMEAAEAAKLARQGQDVQSLGSAPASSASGASVAPGADLGEFGMAGDVNQPGMGGQPQGTVAESSQQIASKLTGGESMADAYKTAPTATTDAQGLSYQVGRDSALQEAAASMTKNDIVAMLERGATNAKSLFGQAADGAGAWMQKNPVASNMVFKALEGMYGPQAEQMDYERGLMDRARRNMNTPVRMQYQTPKTVGG